MKIDKYISEMLNEYDGFKYKSTLTEDQLRLIMARYALDCIHDSELAKEAMEICDATNRIE